jgi:hypothetical protein
MPYVMKMRHFGNDCVNFPPLKNPAMRRHGVAPKLPGLDAAAGRTTLKEFLID